MCQCVTVLCESCFDFGEFVSVQELSFSWIERVNLLLKLIYEPIKTYHFQGDMLSPEPGPNYYHLVTHRINIPGGKYFHTKATIKLKGAPSWIFSISLNSQDIITVYVARNLTIITPFLLTISTIVFDCRWPGWEWIVI